MNKLNKRLVCISLLALAVMGIYAGNGASSPSAQSASTWDLSNRNVWSINGGKMDFGPQCITFTSTDAEHKCNRCNPTCKMNQTISTNSVLYYKVKSTKASFSLRDAKVSIRLPHFTLEGQKGELGIFQLRGNYVGKDKDGYTWIAFDFSKIGTDFKTQGNNGYIFSFQVPGQPKKGIKSASDDKKDFLNVVSALQNKTLAASQFDFIFMSKLSKADGVESFVLGEVGFADSMDAVKAKTKR
jgi:hypothetical protein